jgi:hypothetical protein
MAFNMAHTKHSGRKALVREDVKAIQMAYDRAMQLPPEAVKSAHAPEQGPMMRLSDALQSQ